MWTIECNGDVFGDKTLWLKPGTTHFFGRSQSGKHPLEANTRRHGIDDKSISRNHASIKVEVIPYRYSLETSKRSHIKLEDFSKLGSFLDGEKIKTGKPIYLDNSRHQLKLGNSNKVFTIKWIPISLALTHLSSKTASSGLEEAQKKLEFLDIKLTVKLDDSSSHILASKRNSPAVLEGLISSLYIVTSNYSEAIIKACTKAHGQDYSPLETDFHKNWPDPSEYVPPSGKEPIPRPSELLAPNPARAEVFSKFTIIFFSSQQFDSLGTVIERGGGKAILFSNFKEGQTKPKEFLDFARKIAEQYGVINFISAENSRHINVVKLQLVEPLLDWKVKFMQSCELLIGLASIAQNELLDVILTCDRKPLHTIKNPAIYSGNGNEIDSISSRNGVENSSSPKSSASVDIKKESSPKVKNSASRRFRYVRGVSRFRGFDDFDGDSVPKPASIEEEVVQKDEYEQKDEQDAMEVDSHASQSIQSIETKGSQRGSKRTNRDSALDQNSVQSCSAKRRRLDEATPQKPTHEEKESKPKQRQIFRTTTIPREFKGASELEEAAERADKRAEDFERTNPLTAAELSSIRNGIQYAVIPIRQHALESPTRDQQPNPRWSNLPNYKQFRSNRSNLSTTTTTTTTTDPSIHRPKCTVRLHLAPPKSLVLGSVRWAGAGHSHAASAGNPYDESNNDNNDNDNDNESQFRQHRQHRHQRASRARSTAATPTPGTSATRAARIAVADISESEFSDYEISANLEEPPAKFRRRMAREGRSSAGREGHKVRDGGDEHVVLVASSDAGRMRVGPDGLGNPKKREAGLSLEVSSGTRRAVSRSRMVEEEERDNDHGDDEVRFKGGRRRKKK